MPIDRADSFDNFNDSIIQVLLPAPAVPGQQKDTVRLRPLRRALPDDISFEPPSYFAPWQHPLSTAMFDSIATDTTTALPRFMSIAERDSLEAEAEAQLRADSIRQTITIVRPSNSAVGVEPYRLAQNYEHSTALSGVIAATLAIAALCSQSVRRTLKRYRRDMWSIRKRRNVFDESKSVSIRAAVVLAIIFCVFGGLVLYNLPGIPAQPNFVGAAIAMGVLAGYYVAQLCTYILIGYAFSTPLGSRHWLRGFAATQAFAGLGLIIPALLLVNIPEIHNILVIVSLSIYFLFRIVFISKGFRIFYRDFESWLYFILYLCSIEIIPPVGIYVLFTNILTGSF